MKEIISGNIEWSELLSELSRTTTAYHDAPADLLEYARLEYMEALRNYNLARSGENREGDAVQGFGDPWSNLPKGIF